MAWGLYTTGIN